jgi:hypothetical protein
MSNDWSLGASRLALLLAWSLFAGSAGAQSPIGPDVRVNQVVPGLGDHSDGRLAPLSDGSWRTVWIESPSPLLAEPPYTEYLMSRGIDARGALGPVQQFAQGEVVDTEIGELFLAPASALHFALFFGQSGTRGVLRGRVFDSSGYRVEGFSRSDIGGFWSIAPRQGGLWTALGASAIPLFWEVVDAGGNQVGGPVAITPELQPVTCGYGFAATFEGGGAVTWSVDADPTLHTGDVRARFFTATGELGPEFQVNPRPGTAICPEVAMLPGGREAWILYRDSASFFPPRDGLHLQRVTFAGQRIGREITVSTGPDTARLAWKIAADRFGNFVVVWSQIAFSPGYCGVAGRLYRPDGRPVGKTFPFATVPYQCGDDPWVAFADNGTLAALWTVFPGFAKQDLQFARFSASPADEPCLARGGHLLCDTGRTGGAPEIDLEVSADPAAVLLMGDVDGDGRADPCVVDGRHLRCDLDHRGAPLEWEGDFPPGDDGTGTPLLGDVDGDGKADLCLWRQGTLRCRTGSGPWKESFGRAGDIPLLGDVDGDGRADLCVRRGNRFLCDTAHDGGSPEVTIAFGLPADVPLLGDFDGDGRADPCLLRGNQLLCDTKHNGGLGEGQLTLAVRPGDRPLLANLDGL